MDKVRFLERAPLLLVFLLVSGCAGALEWSQFHADAPNRGFIGVHSGQAAKTKWVADVGNVLFSSPAIGPDSTIYVGNVNGELVAVKPDGSERWRFYAPFADKPIIQSSPAVSSSGLIYFIVNHGVTDKSAANYPGESVLFSLDSLKNVRCTFRFPPGSVTTSSAKTFTSGSNINVYVAGIEGSPFDAALRVFDQECHPIATQTWHCPHDVVGGSIDWDSLLFVFTGGLYGIFHNMFQLAPVHYPLLDPSPAIVDFPGAAGQVIVVAGVTACGLHTFQWGPSAGALTPMWSAPNARNSISSPAISQAGQVVVGQDDGHVLAFDLLSGKPLWDYDAGELVLATPAFFLGAMQVYVPSHSHVHEIDTDGTLIGKINIASTLSSAAVTWDRVYISSNAGLHTLRFNLTTDFVDLAAAHGGSSPIVGHDGTVYAVGADHLLRAYAR
jgi:outer membrane protein assembly factor BamB